MKQTSTKEESARKMLIISLFFFFRISGEKVKYCVPNFAVALSFLQLLMEESNEKINKLSNFSIFP